MKKTSIEHMSLRYGQIGLLADGTAFPESAVATMPLPDNGALVEIHFAVQEGKPVMTRFSVIGAEMPLSSSAIHGIPISAIASEAVRRIAGSAKVDLAQREAMRNAPAGFWADTDLAGRRAVAAFKRRPGPATDAELREVADIVLSSIPAPRLEIRSRLGVSTRTASRWIDEARRRGMVTKEVENNG
jgi:hypothetical protein